MTRFCTVHHKGWSAIDPAWLWNVQKTARFVWLRFIGLNENAARTPDLDSRAVRRWEKACMAKSSRICGGRSAFLWVTFGRTSHLPRPPKREEVIDNTDACRRRWCQSGRIPERIRELVGQLRMQMPWRLGIFAEDFSCRWVMDSGVRPDIMVLDTPMISTAEAEACGLLGRGDVHVRRSPWPPLAFFDDWNLPFDIESLLDGEPSRKRLGTW